MIVISGVACIRGWEEARDGGGGGDGWEVEGGLQLPLGHRQWYCVFSKAQI